MFDSLQVDEKVFYPAHGAGWVRSVKEISFGGETKKYYEFAFINNSLTVSTPVENIIQLGIRLVTQPIDIRKKIAVLKKHPSVEPPVLEFNLFIDLIRKMDLEGDLG